MTQSSSRTAQEPEPSTFGERLLFSIWLAGKVLGVDSAKSFARAIKKGAPQLSKWIREDPRPGWDSIKAIADAVKIDPLWLDDPSRKESVEPEDFREWLAARRQFKKRRA